MQSLVTEENRGQRLDVFVVALYPALSRAFIQRLGNEGHILVDGGTVKTGYKVKVGETVTVDYDERAQQLPVIDLPIIYEDDDVVVINKPPGVLTHAQGAHNIEASVASFLRAHAGADLEVGDRAGVVHRLDRATSGVIIGAKRPEVLHFLQKQFADRRVKKVYVAIVEGHFTEPEALVDMPIERNPKAPATFRVGANGKPATTRYKVIREYEHDTLIELVPGTGRTHQLRVHLSHIGHPVVGDPLYGHGHFGDRLYLHACSLEITLPNRERKLLTTHLPIEFEAYGP
jgi:23S rRNA pseudouridine1911/1915/1917 synthase